MTPRVGDEGLRQDGVPVMLAGSIDRLVYPPICPRCEAAASCPIEVARVFMASQDMEETVWRYRIDKAHPLFCGTCAFEHFASQATVELSDHIRTMLLSWLSVPAAFLAYGALARFDAWSAKLLQGGFSLGELLIASVLGLAAAWCLLTAWRRNDWRRVPEDTRVSAAFAFGDDLSSPFKNRPRRYVFASARYADAFLHLNAAQSAALQGPVQRRRESFRLAVAAGIGCAILLLGTFVEALIA